MKKIIRYLITPLVLVILLLTALVYFLNFFPAPQQNEAIISSGKPPLLTVDKPIKILTWNVQFFSPNQNNHYFYDKGKDPWPTAARYRENIKNVAQIIRRENPDIILLQEVDEDSIRSHYMDQTQELLQQLPKEYSTVTTTFYWRTYFLPKAAVLGRIGLKLVTIAKYKASNAVRYQLARNNTRNYISQQFAPKRALLDVIFPLTNGKSLHVLNTHLSAFSKGSDTQLKQIASINNIMQKIIGTQDYVVLGGDFNILPPLPGFEKQIQPIELKYYGDTPLLKMMYDNYQGLPTLKNLALPTPKQYLTHMPTQLENKEPDKTIDYFFIDKRINILLFQILQQGTQALSDHYPLLVVIRLAG